MIFHSRVDGNPFGIDSNNHMTNKEAVKREAIRELAANFFSRTSNRASMITVTDAEILSKGGRANILITVFPESAEEEAVAFANRQLTDFKKYVEENSRIARIPYFTVRIDKGEKNRQNIDRITN